MSTASRAFRESNLFAAPIRDLKLAIDETPLAPIIADFLDELKAKGVTRLVPRFHLSTEWGVPFSTIVIGIPFYLARPELTELYDEEAWVKLFGSITQPYLEDYRPQPFSRRFVRHLPGWYAQKHPDEDWAETFAVWKTPGRRWQDDYAAWPLVRQKLAYCEQVMHEIRNQPPRVTATDLDEDVGELTMSLADYYKTAAAE